MGYAFILLVLVGAMAFCFFKWINAERDFWTLARIILHIKKVSTSNLKEDISRHDMLEYVITKLL